MAVLEQGRRLQTTTVLEAITDPTRRRILDAVRSAASIRGEIPHHRRSHPHAETLDKSDLKHLDADLYRPLIKRAVQHAQRLRGKHVKDGTSFPEDNPSSSFDNLVHLLKGTAQKLAE